MIWSRGDRFNYPDPAKTFNSWSDYMKKSMISSKKAEEAAHFKSVNDWAKQSMMHASIKRSPEFQNELQDTLGIDWQQKVDRALKNSHSHATLFSDPDPADGGTFFLTEADLPSPDAIRRKPTVQTKQKKKWRPFRDLGPGPGAYDIARSLVKKSFNKAPAVAPPQPTMQSTAVKRKTTRKLNKKIRTQVQDSSMLGVTYGQNTVTSLDEIDAHMHSQHIYGAHLNMSKYKRSMSAPPGGRRASGAGGGVGGTAGRGQQPRIVTHNSRGPTIVKTTSKLGIVSIKLMCYTVDLHCSMSSPNQIHFYTSITTRKYFHQL